MSYCLTVTGVWSRSADYVLSYVRTPKVTVGKLQLPKGENKEAPDVSNETRLIGIYVLRWWRRQSAAIVIQRAASKQIVNRLMRLQKLVQSRSGGVYNA